VTAQGMEVGYAPINPELVQSGGKPIQLNDWALCANFLASTAPTNLRDEIYLKSTDIPEETSEDN